MVWAEAERQVKSGPPPKWVEFVLTLFLGVVVGIILCLIG